MGNKPQIKNLSLPEISLKQASQMTIHTPPTPPSCLLPQNFSTFFCPTVNMSTQSNISSTQLSHKTSISSLKILTYNIWFQQHNRQNRMIALMEIIKTCDADVICLQEVTGQAIKNLYQNVKYITQGKHTYYIARMNMHWYDTIIMTKFPIHFYKIPFQLTGMERSLIMGVTYIETVNGQKLSFSINSTHLQSMNNQKLRISQLQQISSINKKIDIVLFCGDLNFSQTSSQDKLLQAQYIDLWLYSNSKQIPSWTMPQTPQFPQWRPDHIVIKSNKISKEQFIKNKNFQVKISKVGQFTIKPYQEDKVEDVGKDGVVRTPSDHMGLLANFRF